MHRPWTNCALAVTKWTALLVAFALQLAGCIVNPVPTPGSSASTANPATGTDAGSTKDNTGGSAGTDAAGTPGGDGTSNDAGGLADLPVPTYPQVSVTETPIDPAVADPQASPLQDSHRAYFSAQAPSSGRLVVVVPGPGKKSTDYSVFAKNVCRMGHRVLVLAAGNPDVVSTCKEDGNCMEFMRQELVDGQDHSPKLQFKTADGLEQRLQHALLWLQDNATTQGFGGFLSGGQPDWAQLVIVGHGDSAGTAMMVGAKHTVARVALVAGPGDHDSQGAAAWLATHETQSADIIGFSSTNDAHWDWISQAWTALGLGGSKDRVDVDAVPAPYWNAHQLTAKTMTAATAEELILDGSTPGDPGNPQYLQAWWALVGQ